jgi:hypothetical protein
MIKTFFLLTVIGSLITPGNTTKINEKHQFRNESACQMAKRLHKDSNIMYSILKKRPIKSYSQITCETVRCVGGVFCWTAK